MSGYFLSLSLAGRRQQRLRAYVAAERHRAHTTQFVGKRLQRLASEKDRLLDVFLAGDIDRETFRARKDKLEAEIVELEQRMGGQNEEISQTRELMTQAIHLSRNCYEGYIRAPYKTKRLFNLAFFEEIVVKDRAIAKTRYQVPFRQLLSAQGKSVLNKDLLGGLNRSVREPP